MRRRIVNRIVIVLNGSNLKLLARFIEAHISNVHGRESLPPSFLCVGAASGVIVGCDVQGYALALLPIAKLIAAGRT